MGWRSRFSQIYHETDQAASFLDWKDFNSIQDQATTFFRHSDLRTSHQCTAEDAWLSSNTASTGNYSQAVTPSVTKACRAWNYTSVCDCDQQVECARMIILCYAALNVVHRFPRNDSYSTMPLTLQPL